MHACAGTTCIVVSACLRCCHKVSDTLRDVQSGTDWVACGQCHRWQHIACDPRCGLGDLKQFADSGKVFSCVDCSKIKAEQEQQAGSGQAAAGAPIAAQHRGQATHEQMAAFAQQQQAAQLAAAQAHMAAAQPAQQI